MTEAFDDDDMAAVGRALMQRLQDYREHPAMQDWHPAECPSEIVGDLLARLEDTQTDRDAWQKSCYFAVNQADCYKAELAEAQQSYCKAADERNTTERLVDEAVSERRGILAVLEPLEEQVNYYRPEVSPFEFVRIPLLHLRRAANLAARLRSGENGP